MDFFLLLKLEPSRRLAIKIEIRAIPCKGEHDTGIFKYIQVAYIWCQMKAESLYFVDIRLNFIFLRVHPPKFWITQSTYFSPQIGKFLKIVCDLFYDYKCILNLKTLLISVFRL